jgi:hypothetical protein
MALKYDIDIEHLGLLLQPKLNEVGFYLEGVSDIEYAVNPDTRISVYGCVLYFCGAPIKSVTVSSTEAEYFATS